MGVVLLIIIPIDPTYQRGDEEVEEKEEIEEKEREGDIFSQRRRVDVVAVAASIIPFCSLIGFNIAVCRTGVFLVPNRLEDEPRKLVVIETRGKK